MCTLNNEPVDVFEFLIYGMSLPEQNEGILMV